MRPTFRPTFELSSLQCKQAICGEHLRQIFKRQYNLASCCKLLYRVRKLLNVNVQNTQGIIHYENHNNLQYHVILQWPLSFSSMENYDLWKIRDWNFHCIIIYPLAKIALFYNTTFCCQLFAFEFYCNDTCSQFRFACKIQFLKKLINFQTKL